MDNSKNAKCKVSVYIASAQEDLSEERILEGPKSIFVQTLVDGEKLMSAIRAKLGDTTDTNDSVEYTIVLTDLVPPVHRPSSWPRYYGSIYFAKELRVSKHLFAEDLLRVIYKVLGFGETPNKIHGIERIPKGGKPVTTELVNQIREEMGI